MRIGVLSYNLAEVENLTGTKTLFFLTLLGKDHVILAKRTARNQTKQQT
jgi:hypothetical protein